MMFFISSECKILIGNDYSSFRETLHPRDFKIQWISKPNGVKQMARQNKETQMAATWTPNALWSVVFKDIVKTEYDMSGYNQSMVKSPKKI